MITKEDTQHRINILQAFLDEEEIEILVGDCWTNIYNSMVSPNTIFDFYTVKHRIKPKPKDIWVVEDRVFFNAEAASDYELQTSGKFVRKYREVLEDE